MTDNQKSVEFAGLEFDGLEFIKGLEFEALAFERLAFDITHDNSPTNPIRSKPPPWTTKDKTPNTKSPR